ncbi:hypothetical protein [Nonomuraea typhae]|uniref:hypothetical protein n=1 Tax=Nonomuraea typhae TaxID=2603600 RepID=UPI0012FA6D1C|nr:hypothetical protein [Nonomuraea typhae]
MAEIHEHYEQRNKDDAARIVGAASPGPDPTGYRESAPDEFREVLRRTKGEQHHLPVHVDGNVIQLVLNSRGTDDPANEDDLWRWVVRRVRQSIKPGEAA